MIDALELAGMKADEIIEKYNHERKKRSRFQYEMKEELKLSKANTSLSRAKEFCFEFRNFLSNLEKS